MDIFVQNAAFGGSSSLSCVKVDATVFYRMWRNITVGAILMFLTGVQAQTSVTPSSRIPCAGNVPDLKVTVTDMSGSESKTLSCITNCTLSNNPTYIWYKNGEPVPKEPQRYSYYIVNKADAGSYSCAVRGHEDLRSPAVCVFDEKSCWSVTYSTQNICALIGSSVEMHSYYIYPNNYKVTKVLWFSKEQADGEAVDVREDEEYQGRVQDTQSSQNNWSLRITNLTERDAQTYRFRFYTNGGDYTGQPGVNLSVTDLKITVSDSGRGQKTLNCLTTCTLSHNPTYIWYKKGRRVSECKSASCSAAAVSGAVSYSCAVEGHDSLLSPPVYSPKNTRAVVLPSGDTVEGDSVTLSCSSDANPPVLTYSWFKQNEPADTPLTTGQTYSISNISSQDSGLYYCTAHNQLGHDNSTPTHLDVNLDGIQEQKTQWLMFIMVGLAVFLAVTLLSAALWMWKKKSRSADGHSGTGESGQHHSASDRSGRVGSGQANLNYASVRFKNSNTDRSGRDASDDQNNLNYASVRFKNSNTDRSGRVASDDQDNLHYASVHFKNSNTDRSGRVASDDQNNLNYASLHFKNSNTQERSLSPRLLPVTTEDDVQYAAVNVSRSTAARRLVADAAADGPSQIYSNIQKVPTSAV